MRCRLVSAAPITAGLLTLACVGSEERGSMGWEAVRDTVGDTIIVHTVSGSVWRSARLVEEVRIGQLDGRNEYTFGEIAAIATGPDGTLYVLDRHGPILRAYSPEGRFLRRLGREGEGPGELKEVDSGLAVLPDGRVLVRDPGNARITVFTPEGEHDTEWRIRGTLLTSTPLYVDRAGNTYVVTIDFTGDEVVESFVRYGPDGHPRDTLLIPRVGRGPRLRAEWVGPNRRRSASTEVPLWPDDTWALSREGRFLVGRAASYSIDIPREVGVLRVERDFEPVEVLDGERDELRDRTIQQMREVDPGWDWDGPAIPATKPAFRGIMVDASGRLWVYLYGEARSTPAEESAPRDPGSNQPPPRRWHEPVRFDVFDADGTYLGPVEAPDGFGWSPPPAIQGDRVWAVVRDALDVPYVVRFRIVQEGTDS